MKILKAAAVLLTAMLACVALAACGESSDSGGSTSADGEAVAATGAADYLEGFVEAEPTRPDDNPVVDTKQYEVPADQKLVIGYSDASLSNSWRVMAKATTEYAIDQVPSPGAELVYTNANDSAPKQLADIDDLIAQDVDAIIVSAVDVNAVCPAITKAVNAGIPVVIQEREVNCDDYTTFVSMDMENVAENFMSFIAHRLGGEGKVAIISGLPGAGHSVEAERGFDNVVAENPGIEVVAKEYAEYDPAQARQLAQQLLVAHPDIEAFAVISGLMTDGVFRGVQAAGKVDQIKAWVGDDANGWMKLAVAEDLPNLTVPYPVAAGSASVEVAVDILRGKEVHKIEYVPRWAEPIEFTENLAEYADENLPDEWWYNEMPCEYDPFCEE